MFNSFLSDYRAGRAARKFQQHLRQREGASAVRSMFPPGAPFSRSSDQLGTLMRQLSTARAALIEIERAGDQRVRRLAVGALAEMDQVAAWQEGPLL